jgi:hypothetical protein
MPTVDYSAYIYDTASDFWDGTTASNATVTYATTTTSGTAFDTSMFANQLYAWLATAGTTATVTTTFPPAWPQLREWYDIEHAQLQRNMERRMQNNRDALLQDRIDAARVAAKHAPSRKARALLYRNLDHVQRHQLRSDKFFELTSSSGRRMRIRDGTMVGNVDELDANGHRIANYCAHPAGVPVADALLTQKLALEVNDDAFFAVANRR